MIEVRSVLEEPVPSSLGVMLLPAIAPRVDDAESAPWWVWAGFQGFLGDLRPLPVLGHLVRPHHPP